ncbi:Pleckstrin-likey domain-containing family M member 3 [Dirofilaria immitis]|nr:Pleckstrin-likey domain-containing family M member 3 [Dirofilaria immitis]
MMEQNEIKTKLMNEVANVFKQATSEYPSGDALSKESTQVLCNTIEALFIHGLKTAFFQKKPRSSKYPEPNFWPFVSKYTHKAVLDQITALSQIKTEIGKSRAWVRILLNENTIENYLNLLSRNTVTLRLTVDAPINSFSLNTWTPTPLILSGLIVGEPARIKQLIRYRCRSGSLGMLEDTELAENALESLCGSTELSTSSCTESDTAGQEADVTSVYSHPSLLDGENIYLPALNAADSTVLSYPVPEDSILNCDPHQIRVIRSAYRRIRRSSKNSSVGSSESSRNESISTVPSESHNVEKIEKKWKIPKNLMAMSSKLHPQSEEKMMHIKKDKPFGPDNELSVNSECAVHEMPKSSQNDSEKWTDSCIVSDDVADDFKQNHSIQNMSHNVLYNLCPAISTEDEQSFIASGSKIGNISKKPLDMELQRSVSMQDNLYVPEHYSEGNSLLGKGWIVHDRWKAEPLLVGQASTITSSTNTDSSGNLEMEIRNVLGVSDEVVNQKRSDSGSLNHEIPILEEVENLLQLAVDGDKTSFSISDHQEGVLPKKSESEIDSSGNASEFSDEKLIKILTVIPHEKGLDSQNFRCLTCRKSIGPTFASYRKCNFDEKYYCNGCFGKGNESIIPWRLIRNWDGRARHVCRSNMIFIESIRDKAVLHIDQINPQLYTQSNALNAVKFLREKLSLSAMYLQSCRKSVAEDLESRIRPKDYFYKDIHLYSFADLLTVISGYMETHLNNLLNFTTEHIRRCLLCSQKGFICEICSSAEVIYPFQIEMTSRCLICFSVYHKRCLEKQRCPKCIRRERYTHQQPNIDSQYLLFDMD